MARRSTKRIRIRSKRLDQLDETKLALALWLLAKETLADDDPANAGNGQVALPTPPADESDAEAA